MQLTNAEMDARLTRAEDLARTIERDRCMDVAAREVERNRKLRAEAARILPDATTYYLWAEQTAERIRREIAAGV